MFDIGPLDILFDKNFLVTMVVVNLLTIIPSAPGFVGVFQFGCLVGLGLYGVNADVASGFGLVLNVGEYLPVTLLGIAFMMAEQLSFNAVMKQEGGEEPPAAASNNVPPVSVS